MDIKAKIEITRNVLAAAVNQNKDDKTILNISRELDKLIVDYYSNHGQQGKNGSKPQKHK